MTFRESESQISPDSVAVWDGASTTRRKVRVIGPSVGPRLVARRRPSSTPAGTEGLPDVMPDAADDEAEGPVGVIQVAEEPGLSEEALRPSPAEGEDPGTDLPEGDRQGSAADRAAGGRRSAGVSRSVRSSCVRALADIPLAVRAAARRRWTGCGAARSPPTTSSSCPRAASSTPEAGAADDGWPSPGCGGSSARSSASGSRSPTSGGPPSTRASYRDWIGRNREADPEASSSEIPLKPALIDDLVAQGASSCRLTSCREVRATDAGGTRELQRARDARRAWRGSAAAALLLEQIEQQRPHGAPGQAGADGGQPAPGGLGGQALPRAASCPCSTSSRRATSAS